MTVYATDVKISILRVKALNFDHEVVLLCFESLTSSSESPSHVVCKWHPKFRASIGCQKCEVPVCDQCLIREHNGHNVIAIAELFRLKKEKLEQKLSTVRSELPKYESELEMIRRRQMEVSKNKDIVKKGIGDYFDKAISTINASRHQLLKSVDEKTSADINILKDKENSLQSYVQNMREYVVNIQNDDLQEKIAFIFYSACALDDNMPHPTPLLIPKMLQYSEGRFDKAMVKTLSGRVFHSTENIKLLDITSMKVVKSLNLGNNGIISLAYCSDPEAFCVHFYGGNAFVKYDGKGNELDTLRVEIGNLRNKPICVFDNEKLLFRYNASEIYMLEDSQKKLFFDATPLAVASICPTKDDELLIGLVKTPDQFAVGRFTLTGECKQYITPMFNKWTPEPLFSNENNNRLYVNENVNGDICLSFGIVHVLRGNGEHRFTYIGKEAPLSQLFLSRGICTNILGNILVADENNRAIHVLDKDGGFLTMLTIPGEPQVIPISLCKDNQNNICIGCADGKIRILEYLG